MESYGALEVSSVGRGSDLKIVRTQQIVKLPELSNDDIVIRVKYVALNYHDALALVGRGRRTFPYIPGTDISGVVVNSNSSIFQEGDEVIVTGYDLGYSVSGGFGRYVKVPASWAIRLPIGMGMKTAMIYGTAGIAAGIASLDLINTGIVPNKSSLIAVTNASFDYGSLATALLSHLGFGVVAYVNDDSDSKKYVERLGATEVRLMSKLAKSSSASLLDDPIYDGVYDTFGGDCLATLLKCMKQSSTVIVAGSIDATVLTTPINPFTSRGINMLGVDSIRCNARIRERIWQKYAGDWKLPQLDWLSTEISMDELEEYIPLMLECKAKGRVVLNHNI